MKRSLLGLSVVALALNAGLPFGASAQAVPQSQQQPAAVKALVVGDDAPTLKVAKWVKGKEVNSFEKGKIYVVEGWATWCSPCIRVIPHMTELAKKHKDKITFVGVSVWESNKPEPTTEAYHKRVEAFVENMSEKMDYNVAIDTATDSSGHVATNWLRAANQNGIPAAFVVNGEGKVAWIGHPGQIDKVLDQVVAGTWDMKAEAAKAQKERAEREQFMADRKPVVDAMRAKNYPEAAKAYDGLIAKYPDRAAELKLEKFRGLIVADSALGTAAAKDLAAKEAKGNTMILNELAWTILDNKRITNPDYAAALEIAKQASEAAGNNDPMILDTLAVGYFKTGNVEKAIEIQTKAVELTAGADAATQKELKDRLAEFKAAKK